MKYETSELGGLKLDQAVAKALGASPPFAPGKCRDVVGLIDTPPYEYDDDFLPSSIWAQGGPIIDRYGIAISGRKSIADPLGFSDWVAHINGICLYGKDDVDACGCTALIAAMRAFVAFKLGAEVDL